MRNLLALAILVGAAVAAGWAVASAAAPELAAGPAAGAGGPIRIGLPRFRCELQAAAEAYAKLHPEVNVIFGEEPSKARREFLAGRLDVLGYESDLFYQDQASSDELQEYGKTHSKPPQERTVAYWPYAVAVHPTNPMKAITVAQLRQLFFNPEARWPHLGRSTDGRIRLYVVDSRRIAQTLVAPGKEREAQQLSSRAVSKHRVPTPTIIGDAIYKAMADDKDGIVVWMHSNQLADIGFKNLPIVGAPGKPGALPTDVAAVASGRYPLRLPLRVATHPEAPEHVQAFVAWLQTPQAAEAMASAQISRDNFPSPIAHVSMAEKDVP
jgi:ABC-type phosphate transport system substrate-binding protein